jgi:KTSC domain
MKTLHGVFASRVNLNSSAIALVAYDDHRWLFLVEFRDGAVYLYRDVPPAVYDALLSAPSQGAYFNRTIRDTYAYSRYEA